MLKFFREPVYTHTRTLSRTVEGGKLNEILGFRKLEFQKSLGCGARWTLSPVGLSRILVARHPSCPSNQARTWRTTQGNPWWPLGQDRDNNRAERSLSFPRIPPFQMLRIKTRCFPQIAGSCPPPHPPLPRDSIMFDRSQTSNRRQARWINPRMDCEDFFLSLVI